MLHQHQEHISYRLRKTYTIHSRKVTPRETHALPYTIWTFLLLDMTSRAAATIDLLTRFLQREQNARKSGKSKTEGSKAFVITPPAQYIHFGLC